MWPTTRCSIADALEVGGRAQAVYALHPGVLGRGPRGCSAAFLDDGQALAATQAATLQDRSAGGGEHALQKAMLASTRDAFGLVRPLGHGKQVLRGAEPTRLGRIGSRTTPTGRWSLGGLAASISTRRRAAPKNRTGARLLHRR